MDEDILAKLQESFSQLQQLTAYLDEVESKEKAKEESQKRQINETTTIEVIEDTSDEKSESKGSEDDSPISFLEANLLRCADLPFTIDEIKKSKKTLSAEDSVNIEITSIPVLLLDLKPAEIMTTAAAIVGSLLETQHPVLPGQAVRMKNEKSYVSVYRKSASEVLFTWVTYPSETEIKDAIAEETHSHDKIKETIPSYIVLIDKGIKCASVIFKCTKTDDSTLTFEFNSASLEDWSTDISTVVTNMVGRFFASKKRRQGGQLVGKKAYMNLTRMSDDEVLFTWITYPRA